MRSAHRSTTLRTCAGGSVRERRVVLAARTARPRLAPTAGSIASPSRRRAAARSIACAGCERGPTVREPTHVVRLGRLEPTDTERAVGRRAGSGAPGGGRRRSPTRASGGRGAARPVGSGHGAILARMTVAARTSRDPEDDGRGRRCDRAGHGARLRRRPVAGVGVPRRVDAPRHARARCSRSRSGTAACPPESRTPTRHCRSPRSGLRPAPGSSMRRRLHAMRPLATIVGDAIGRLQAAYDAMLAAHPAEPHYYLAGARHRSRRARHTGSPPRRWRRC